MPFWPALHQPAVSDAVEKALARQTQVPVEAPQAVLADRQGVEVDEAGYQDIGDGVIVRAKRTVFRPNGVIEFTDGVEAIYDVTTIKADRLIAYTGPDQGFAEAIGNVSVLDPVGTIQARSLKINWKTAEGEAEDVKITVPHLFIRAKRVVVKGTKWEAFDARVTPCGRETPILEIGVQSIAVETGKAGVARRPTVLVGGRRLGSLPNQRINLDRRATGIQLPAVSYRASDGLGMTWSSGSMLDDRTSLEASFGTFQNTRPDAAIAWTRTFIAPESATSVIALKSELTERFSSSYMERIRVGSPTSEERFMREPRQAFSLSAAINRGANEAYRLGGGNFTKPLEAAYELGGAYGPGAGIAQLRLQTIFEGRQALQARSVLSATYLTDPLRLAPDLGVRLRADSSAYLGSKTSAWMRASVNLAWQPHERVVLGASVGAGKNFGEAMYRADQLDKLRNVNFRADFDLGPTQFSTLLKIDPRTGKLFGREFIISQIMGCFEPYLESRSYPRSYQFGIRFRGGDFYRALRSRTLSRPDAAAPKSKVFLSPPRAARKPAEGSPMPVL